ncbi:MAG: hypothetical protein HY758_00575, partial [Nitrospirae bacterium]|nr:hypothetical protein [Nitrospirota bacterium]
MPPYLTVLSSYIIDSRVSNGAIVKIDAGKVDDVFGAPLTAEMFYTEVEAGGTLRTFQILAEPPDGAPYLNDGRMEFNVVQGGGGVKRYTKPDDPGAPFSASVIQTEETNGQYSAALKLGETPGKNTVVATGKVTALVPKIVDGELIMEPKEMSDPTVFEVWGLKITVPEYQTITVNDEGYLAADVTFQYTIEPTAYPYQPVNLSLEIFEVSSTGAETSMGFVQADDQRKLILSTGTAQFSRENTYYAQVVFNRGLDGEVRSDKVFLIRSALIPDYDRDGKIDYADRKRAVEGDTFYFWINDDDDVFAEGSDIPGGVMSDHGDMMVDGVRDLIDFFPVYLDIKDLLNIFDPGVYGYMLHSEDESVNFVLTDMEPDRARYYLTGNDISLEPALTLGTAFTRPVNPEGTLLNFISGDFLEKIKNDGKGIILIEGNKKSTKPLELAVYDESFVKVFSMKLN